MSAEFFLTHGAAETTAGTEVQAPIDSGVAGGPGPTAAVEPSISSEPGEGLTLAKEGTRSEPVTERGLEALGHGDDERANDWTKGSNSYDELRSNFYTAASRILGSTAE